MSDIKFSQLSQTASIASTDLIAISQDQGSETYDSRKITFGDFTANTFNTITVSSTNANYTSIKSAMDSITDNATDNRYVIKIYPGDYTEDNPVIGKDYVSIICVGRHEVTRMLCSNSSAHGFVCGKDTDVVGLQIQNASDNGSAGFHVTGTTSDVDIHDCKIKNCDIGWLVETTGESIIIRESMVTGGSCTNVIKITAEAGAAISDLQVEDTVTIVDCVLATGSNANADITASTLHGGMTNTALKADNGGLIQCVAMNIDDATNAISIGTNGGTIRGSGIEIRNSGTWDILTESSNSTIRLSSVLANSTKISLATGTDEIISFIDQFEGDEGFTIFGELHVGSPARPTESVFGGGDSYTNGMKVYTYDGTASYVDVSSSAESQSGSTFTFPAATENNAIYVASSLENDSDKLKFQGVKANIVTAANVFGGEIIVQFWNGAWSNVASMSTDSGGNFTPHGDALFERVASEQIRFDHHISDDWIKNDPVSYGTNLYWVRFINIGNITTAPIFQQFKLHTSRTEINADGYLEFFGDARPFGELPWNVKLLSDIGATMGNQDLWMGQNLGLSLVDNVFDTDGDYTGFISAIPSNVDTSSPIHLKWATYALGTGAVNWIVRWGFTRPGETISTSNPGSPSVRQFSNSFSSTSVTGVQNWYQVPMLIQGAVAKRDNGYPDTLWVTIERDTGTANNQALMAIDGEYLQWCVGAHS